MAKTVADKLLIRQDSTVWWSHGARGEVIGPLPDGARTVRSFGQASVAVLFADNAASLRTLVGKHAAQLALPRVFWVPYPKANRTDINRDSIWPILSEHRMRPIGQVAIDEIWSAVRFRPLAPDEPGFGGADQRKSGTGGQ